LATYLNSLTYCHDVLFSKRLERATEPIDDNGDTKIDVADEKLTAFLELDRRSGRAARLLDEHARFLKTRRQKDPKGQRAA
jgi:hypothetical protein